ncbi:hypothetical protein [Burkholderia pseudomallei]|uniref:hypothetical protein n=1 Tax=Burkholderia pseudomallei TaxID=28450 RepID=UPI001177E970|nr:hypothetical protein [Burkholderia pseudomallei]MBF3380603.1 hypothetical protein [Burkholderia pseudomallei]MBF3402799.1 hypothetical protein [Burkholderia pseudomallei]
MKDSLGKRTYSDESRERMRTSALARYDTNAEATHERVRAVMKAIQEEMAANEGIYPHNKGAVSQAEVARRAEIHPNTLHKTRYVLLGEEVKDWLDTLKQGTVVGRMRVRKELGTRVQEWKQLYEDLRETHRITETDLAHANELLKEARRENEELRARVSELTKQKVLPLRAEGK